MRRFAMWLDPNLKQFSECSSASRYHHCLKTFGPILSGLEFTTCRFAFPLCGISVRRDIAKTLLYRQLMQIGSLLVCGSGVYVRVECRFVSLICNLVSFPRLEGRLLDVVFSYRRLSLEAPKPLSQLVMPSS